MRSKELNRAKLLHRSTRKNEKRNQTKPGLPLAALFLLAATLLLLTLRHWMSDVTGCHWKALKVPPPAFLGDLGPEFGGVHLVNRRASRNE